MNHTIRLFLFVLIGISYTSFGQTSAMEWEKSLGGSDMEIASSIRQTADGGLVVVGTSRSNDFDVTGNNGNMDCWVVKLSSTGNLIWQKSLGGSNLDNASSIEQTSDGGFIVAGTTRSIDGDVSGNQGEEDIWIVKLGVTGIIAWEKTFGGTLLDKANSVKQTSDGGYIIAGSTTSADGDVTGYQGNTDLWVVKLDATGNLIWQKSLGGTGRDEAYSINQTVDGGYILAGVTSSDDGDVSVNIGSSDYWIVKLGSAGNISWEKTLGGSNQDLAYSIQQTTDGGYIVGGSSISSDGDITGSLGDLDCWVVKLDILGNITWDKSIGTASWDKSNSVQQTNDGGYIVAGETASINGFTNYFIARLDPTGNVLTEETMGGSSNDYSSSIIQTDDGGYVVAGTVSSNDGDVTINNGVSDIWVVKLGAHLSIEEQSTGEKEVVKIVNLLGQETNLKLNTPLIYIYSDGTTKKVFSIE